MRDARYFVVDGRLYLLSGGGIYEWTSGESGPGWRAAAMPSPAFTAPDGEWAKAAAEGNAAKIAELRPKFMALAKLAAG